MLRWERAGFTDEHPRVPGWQVRFRHRPQPWAAFDAIYADESDAPESAAQQAWAQGIRAEFPADGAIRCDIRTFLPWGDDLETDFGFAIRHARPQEILAALDSEQLMRVDEWGAEWPDDVWNDEVYTPNYIFGPETQDGLVTLSVDSKGVSYSPMWRTMLCIVRDQLLAAGVRDAVLVPMRHSHGRPETLGSGLLAAGDVGHVPAPPAEATPWQRYTASLRAQLREAPPPVDLADQVHRRCPAEAARTALDDLLLELSSLPGFLLAAREFWPRHQAALARVVAGHAEMADRLLGAVPPGLTPDDWLAYLKDLGVQPESLPPERLGEFLQRLVEAHPLGGPRQGGLLELLSGVAPRLSGTSIAIRAYGPARVLPLDVADLLVRHGLAGALDGVRFELRTWLLDRTPGRRDLSALADHPGVGPRLLTALTSEIDGRLNPELWTYPSRPIPDPGVDADWLLREVSTVAGLAGLLREWVTGQVAALVGAPKTGPNNTEPNHTGPNLAEASVVVSRLAAFDCDGGRAIAGERLAALAGFDPAPALAATLRGGILAELGWPAFEEALAELATSSTTHVGEWDAWPSVIVSDGARVIVVDPDGIRPELALPTELEHVRCLFEAGGDVLVTTASMRGASGLGRWLIDGGEVRIDFNGTYRLAAASLPLPDGSRLYDRTALRRGATRMTEACSPVLGDGSRFWYPHFPESGPEEVYREVNPRTGRLGERSLPAWTGRATATGVVHLDSRPCPEALRDTVFNRPAEPGGLLGLVVVDDPDGRRHLRTAAGVERVLDPSVVLGTPRGLLDLPGRPGLVVTDAGVFDRDGRPLAWHHVDCFQAGWPRQLRFPYWYCLRPRDAALSAHLREATADEVTGFCDPDTDPAEALATFATGTPDGAVEPGIAAAIHELGRFAARLWDLTERLAHPPAPADGRPPMQASPELTDERIGAAVNGTLHLRGYSPGRREGFESVHAARAVQATLFEAATDISPHTLRAGVAWLGVLDHPAAAIARALSEPVSSERRDTLLSLVDGLAAAGLLDPRIRHETRAAGRHRTDTFPVADSEALIDIDGSMYGDGVAHLVVRHPEPQPDRPDADVWRALVRAARETPRWDASGADRLADPTGLTRAEATLLLSGLPTWTDVKPLAGLHPQEKEAAHTSLHRHRGDGLRAVLAAGVPRDPERLRLGPEVDAMAAEYVRQFGRRPRVPEELVPLVLFLGPRAPSNEIPTLDLLRDWLTVPPDSPTLFVPSDPPARDARLPFRPALGLLLWACYRIPAGHSWRPRLAPMLRQLRESVAHPEAIIGPGEDEAAWLAEQGGGGEVLLTDLTEEPSQGSLHDPRVSAPRVVADAVERLSLTENAAVLLLQLIALPDPVDWLVEHWNSWTPSELATARKAVAAVRVEGRPVVVRRKRATAGRSLFLPGDLRELGSNPPFEWWKTPLVSLDDRPIPSGVIVPTMAHGRLFATAWQRWLEDPPVAGR